jgi:hypothetical protein|tara:strand:- start:8 stop:205 length:198 start_codon:yes stop_codon:yes gene_type:complete
MPKGDYPVQDFIVKRITRMLDGPVTGLAKDVQDLVKRFKKPKRPKTYNVKAGGSVRKSKVMRKRR